MGGEIGVKTIVYNTKRKKRQKGGKEKKKEKGRGNKREKKDKKRENGGRNTAVKEKNSVLSILLLGHDQGYFLYMCMCNFFLLIRYSNIFSLDSD